MKLPFYMPYYMLQMLAEKIASCYYTKNGKILFSKAGFTEVGAVKWPFTLAYGLLKSLWVLGRIVLIGGFTIWFGAIIISVIMKIF